MKKLTVSEINKKVAALFSGDVVIDWDKSGPYKHNKQKVTAVHKLFGPWQVSVDKLLLGRNHPSSTCRFHSKEDLDLEIKKIHKGVVSIDWSKSNFPIFTHDYIYVVDKDYGPWKLKLYSLLKGESHRQRYYDSKKLSQKEVDSRIQEIFKGEVSILWEKDYLKRKSRIWALDSVYGKWNTTVDLLLRGIQHPSRAIQATIERNTLSTSEIDERIKKIHKGKVSVLWNGENHTNIKNKVSAHDVDFGTWQITINALLAGQGHRQRHIATIKHTESGIDKKLKKIFKGEVWVNWEKSGPHHRVSDKIIAVHKTKGEWSTTVAKLLEGHNHPGIYSNRSKGEKELVSWLRTKKLKVKTQSVITYQNKNYEMDIYIPELNLAIEFNGIYYHCEIFRGPEYHISKRLACESQGINLIQIYESEWLRQKDLVKDYLTLFISPLTSCDFKQISLTSTKKIMKTSSFFVPKLKSSYKYLAISKDSQVKGVLAYSIKNYQLTIHGNLTHLNLDYLWPEIEAFFKHNFNILSISFHIDHRLEIAQSFLSSGFNILETSINHIWTDLKYLYLKKVKKPRLLKIYEPGKSLLIKYL